MLEYANLVRAAALRQRCVWTEAISFTYGVAMRARQLEVFIAIMRAGTVTAAARTLNISQPALSQILLHAEDELGFTLFERVKGRLRPTPEALEIFPDAERLSAGLDGLRRKTTDLRLGRAGLVRVAASPPPAMAILPRAFTRFRAQHPNILLRSHSAPIAAIVDMLRAGDASLGVAMDDRLPPDIEAEVIVRWPPHSAADQKSPVAAPQVQDDGRLSAEKFLPIQIPFGQLLESGLRPLFRPQDFAGNGNAELPLDLSAFFHGLRLLANRTVGLRLTSGV